MVKLYKDYLKTFDGLSREVWWLSLITLINRAGTMVIPFLSLYLTKNMGFTLSDVGWIMSCFGLGSVAGSWLGGKLTDRIGYYHVMLFSLFSTGVLFIGLQFLSTFESICIGIFLVMLVADSFRPAMYVALSAYSKPENKTRSVTLIRLAINLGFSAGPAVGGLIIATMGYEGLFWVDGITCIIAGILLLYVLHPRSTKVQDEVVNNNPISAYRDKSYWIFLAAMLLFGIVFLQYFSTIPIYYKDAHSLSEQQIGLLMAMNGLVIALFEMPLIKWLEGRRNTKSGLMAIGVILVALSFVVLNLTSWVGILIIGMLLMTIGEMIFFPFSNSYALQRAKRGNQGEYMAMYSIAFSVAHIFGHNSGMQLIDRYGFDFTWHVATIMMILCILLLYILRNRMIKKINHE
ncbi:MAG: MFS transporter [Flavobacteriaceae bacterium]|nr:MFS transporter [Flavobacteriaceae bacterium]RZV70262.1 MAG: MFS transporter [Flavobacteriaceae bacterium]